MSNVSNTNEYTALVGRGTIGYRELFAPGSDFLAENGSDVVMQAFTGETPVLKWRVWIPAGTRSFQCTVYTRTNTQETKIVMRMHQPPVGNLGSVTPENSAAVDLTNVLASLVQGAEVPCYAPPASGFVKLSAGMMDSPVIATTGAWLYIHALQVPGNQIYKLDTYISADKAKYNEWYNTCVWDADGNPTESTIPVKSFEAVLVDKIIATGLAEALRRLSGGKPDAELIQAVVETGVWESLLRFAKMD